MPGTPVHLDRPPHSAFLVTWGRASAAWWGCVEFSQPVRTPSGLDDMPVAAWVPAASLTQPGWAGRVQIPRVTLDDDRTTWPAPAGWPSWYAGVWPHGPLALPAGVEIATGPRWRDRRRRV